MQAFFNTSKPVWFRHSWILYSLNKILYRKVIELICKKRSVMDETVHGLLFLLKKNEKYICLEPVKIIIIIKKIKVLTKSIVLNTQYTYY